MDSAKVSKVWDCLTEKLESTYALKSPWNRGFFFRVEISVIPICRHFTKGSSKSKLIVCMPAQIPRMGLPHFLIQLNLSTNFSEAWSFRAVPESTILLQPSSSVDSISKKCLTLNSSSGRTTETMGETNSLNANESFFQFMSTMRII